MDKIKETEISYRKAVGKVDGSDVMEMATRGGLHLIILNKGGSFETLGVGPHRAVARFIADQNKPGIKWIQLAKSDHVSRESILPLLPKYTSLTNAFRSR